LSDPRGTPKGPITVDRVFDRIISMKIECGGLLFDLDGVLVDSTPAVARAWSAWAARHGFEAAEVVRKAHGRPSMTTIRELLPDGDHETENREMERCEIGDVEGVVALPGAMELLEALPPGRWTIVTSCTRPLAKVRIAAARLLVPDKLVTSSDVNRGKPDPEPYLAGAARLELAPEKPQECACWRCEPPRPMRSWPRLAPTGSLRISFPYIWSVVRRMGACG